MSNQDYILEKEQLKLKILAYYDSCPEIYAMILSDFNKQNPELVIDATKEGFMLDIEGMRSILEYKIDHETDLNTLRDIKDDMYRMYTNIKIQHWLHTPLRRIPVESLSKTPKI